MSNLPSVLTLRRHHWLCALAILGTSLASGCRYHHDDDETLVVSNTSFAYDIDGLYDSSQVTVFWDTVLDQGRVELRVRQFYDGYIRVRVYDDTGFKIFDEEYHDTYWPDDEYREVDFTAIGVPGTWEVRLEYFHLDGHLYLNID